MKKIICILSTVLLVCCQNKSVNKFEKLEKMNWLVGNWEQKLPDGKIIETWSKKNDSTFLGKSFFIKDKDTLHLESIILSQKKDLLLYIPTVKGQNNDEPTTFTMTSDVENVFSFENSTHDYPQKITYKKLSDTNLIATISGKQQGKESQESYAMKKK